MSGSIVHAGSYVGPSGDPAYVASPPLGGSVQFLSAAYNLTTGDNNKYLICSGGSWALGLPAPQTGLVYRVRNDQGITGTTGTITITPASGSIDGATNLALLAGQDCTILTDGTVWRSFGRHRRVIVGTQDLSNAATGVILLPPGYRYYELTWEDLVPATSSSWLVAQVSANGGNTWIATGYAQASISMSGASAVSGGNVTNQTTAEISNYLGNSGGNTAGLVRAILFPGDGVRGVTCLASSGAFYGAGAYVTLYNTHWYLNSNAIANALTYFMNSGNILVSQLTVEGIV